MTSDSSKIAAVFLVTISIFISVARAEVFGKGEVPNFAADGEKATLYVYREWNFVGGGADFGVYLNDNFVGESENGTVLWVHLKPGFQDVWVTNPAGLAPQFKELFVEKGKNYYIGLEVSMSGAAMFELDAKQSQKSIIEILK